MDPLIWIIVAVVMFSFAWNVWMLYLYVHEWKNGRLLIRDNMRLMARLGQYHNLNVGIPDDKTLPPIDTSAAVPAAFRMKKPIPPPGWKPKKGVDEGVRQWP